MTQFTHDTVPTQLRGRRNTLRITQSSGRVTQFSNTRKVQTCLD
jgi:hypothetical protein